ncbi:MAG: branched-chain amino acid transaminase [Bryobacteraceae bacterium]|jgi:branched-chain amino acid aminotransferase
MSSNEHDPSTIVYFDNRYVPLAQAQVGVLTHALNYGTGVFEGIRGYWDAERHEILIVQPAGHYLRWKRNAGILHLDIPLSAEQLIEVTAELLRRNAFHSDIYVRPLVWKSAQRIGVHADDRDSFTIVAVPFGVYMDSTKGLHAGVSSWRRLEDNAIPGRAKICGAYVNSALATDDVRRCGFDEAIFLSENGHVAEGATCNIFMVRNGRLITPGPADNILEGITRACVIELARDVLRLEVVERSIDRSELYVCDELFFSGTAVEVAPVTRVDHRRVGAGAIGPVASELRRLYTEATRGRLPQFENWIRRVPLPVAIHA